MAEIRISGDQRAVARQPAALLEMAGVDAGYGLSRILFRVDLRVCEGGGGGPARTERRRKSNDAQDHCGTHASDGRTRAAQWERDFRQGELRDCAGGDRVRPAGSADLRRPHGA